MAVEISSGFASLLAASALLLYTFYAYIVQRRNRLRFITQHHCKSATSSYPHHPLLFGLDFVRENARNVRNHCFTNGVQERFRKFGRTHISRILWGHIINTIDPENLETVMVTEFDSWTIIPQRSALVKLIFGEGIFAAEGSEWKHSRALIRRGMSSLPYQPDIMEYHLDKIYRAIDTHKGDSLEFAELAFEFSVQAATDLLIGSDRSASNATIPHVGDRKQFAVDFATLSKIARFLTFYNRRIPFLANILFWKTYSPAKRRLFDAVDHQISAALQSRGQKFSDPVAQGSLVEKLVIQSDDAVRIRSEVLNMLLGGRDSVGIVLSESLYLLARHPNVRAKLRKEVAEICSDRIPTHSELHNMAYLSHVINEALRLRPPLAVHGRRAIKDTCLPRGGGPDGRDAMFVPKGSWLGYSNYALHRDPAVFGSDADDFRPERWDDISPTRYEFMSFGAGYRSCPGRRLAWIMAAYALVRLAQRIEKIEPRDDRPWTESVAFSYCNLHGTRIAMHPATQDNL